MIHCFQKDIREPFIVNATYCSSIYRDFKNGLNLSTAGITLRNMNLLKKIARRVMKFKGLIYIILVLLRFIVAGT